ncbi:MAG: 2-C-methyl-D-erythritol 4-phosphate cytidylyltransferase [Bacteroidota bacterium]
MASGDVWAVVPAAGLGTRMGEGARKQFRMLGGEPVLVRSLRVLASVVDAVVVAVREVEVKAVRGMLSDVEDLRDAVHAVVAGGDSRQASVARGLDAVPKSAVIVLVHDAVRPFVTPEAVRAVAEAVREHGAAALAVPVADTLRAGRDGAFGETVDRSGLWRMQTPQGARRDLLADALARAQQEGLVATDEVGALTRAGVEVAIVDGDERNLKLTRPADWALAEAIWAQRSV